MQEHPSVRQLVTVDVTTGVVTDIGSTGLSGDLSFADLAFDASGVLYGVTGDGSPILPRQLFTLNKSTGAATFFMSLGNGTDGEAIGYNPDNGLLYHASGVNNSGAVPPPPGLVFESINLSTKAAPTRITLSNSAPIQEAAALTYAGEGAFLWSSLDFNDNRVFRLMRVTTTGAISVVGITDHLATGLAFVPTVRSGNSVPTLTSTTPGSVVANSGAFTLTVSGQGFVNGTTVRWNGAARPTNFVSSTQVTAAISAADVVTAGIAQVTVVNPAPGGGVSAARSFSITAAPPPPGTGGAPTVAFVLPRNRGVYLDDRPLSIRLSIGGDQTSVADFLVTFDGAQP